MNPLKALSLWQPWAWALIHAGKDVENRPWRTNYRGRLYIHAAKRKPTDDELWSFLELFEGANRERCHRIVPNVSSAMEYLRSVCWLGGMVGHVDLVDCVRSSGSPWGADDQWHWKIANPVAIPFVPYRGRQGLFNIDWRYVGIEGETL